MAQLKDNNYTEFIYNNQPKYIEDALGSFHFLAIYFSKTLIPRLIY